MNREQGFDRLVFNNDKIINKFIQPIARVHRVAIIGDGQLHFCQNCSSTFSKFKRMAFTICRLQQSWPQSHVNLNCRINNIPCYILNINHLFFPSY